MRRPIDGSQNLRLPFQRGHFPSAAGAALQKAREAAGRSRVEVAEAASIAPRTLARIERGAQTPTWPTLERICRALDVGTFAIARRWASDAMDLPNRLGSAPGLAVRSMRRVRGLTLVELAKLSGVSVSTLSRFERGITASRLLVDQSELGGGRSAEDARGCRSLRLAEALGFDDLDDLRAACMREADEVEDADDHPLRPLDADGLPLTDGLRGTEPV